MIGPFLTAYYSHSRRKISVHTLFTRPFALLFARAVCRSRNPASESWNWQFEYVNHAICAAVSPSLFVEPLACAFENHYVSVFQNADYWIQPLKKKCKKYNYWLDI